MTGEVVGVFYNKAKLKKLGLKMPTTFQQFEAAVAEGAERGRDADPVRQPRQVAGHPRVRGAHAPERHASTWASDWIFGARGGKINFTSPGTLDAAHEAPAVGEVGLLHEGLRGPRLRPVVGRLRQGQGRLPDQRQLADRRPEEGARQGRRLLPAAAAVGQARWSRSAARACRGRSARSRRTPTPRRPTSTSSPNNASMQVVADNGNLTATKATGRRCRPASTPRSSTPGRRLNDDGRDRPVPRLGDADDVRHDHGRDPGAAGRQDHAAGLREQGQLRLLEVP